MSMLASSEQKTSSAFGNAIYHWRVYLHGPFKISLVYSVFSKLLWPHVSVLTSVAP